MREILFRGKAKDSGKWAQGYAYKIWEQAFILWGMVNEVPDMIEVDPETVCQYTGMTDKNGNKIFERDIVVCKQYIGGNFVDYHCEIGYVEMKHGAFGLHRKQGYYRPFKDWLEDYEYEVIGNVFDHPELLEVD